MSVKIRLRRMGKKKQPHYRIVVTDSRAPRDGRFVENIGYYNPMSNPGKLKVDLGRVDYWVGQGAIVSSTVGSLVSKARAGGDDGVSLVGASSEGDASPQAVAANGDAPEAVESADAKAVVAAATEGDESAEAEAASEHGDAPAAPAASEAADDADADADAGTDADADAGAA